MRGVENIDLVCQVPITGRASLLSIIPLHQHRLHHDSPNLALQQEKTKAGEGEPALGRKPRVDFQSEFIPKQACMALSFHSEARI